MFAQDAMRFYNDGQWRSFREAAEAFHQTYTGTLPATAESTREKLQAAIQDEALKLSIEDQRKETVSLDQWNRDKDAHQVTQVCVFVCLYVVI